MRISIQHVFQNSFFEPNRDREFPKSQFQITRFWNKILPVSVKGLATRPLLKAIVKYQLSEGAKCNMANIFRVFHVFTVYFTSPKANEIRSKNMRNMKNVPYCTSTSAITSLSHSYQKIRNHRLRITFIHAAVVLVVYSYFLTYPQISECRHELTFPNVPYLFLMFCFCDF